MLYEQPLKSFSELVERLRSLDQDAGIRLVGRSGGKRVLVFVTRFGPKYTMMTYTVRPRTGTPLKKLDTREFDSPEGVGAALRTLVRGRLQAWLY
ncbi:MAG: hypothetical protein JRN06_01575 [Nitrososphaerota archaeon]|nr:hypothetical protein [Nitrososphaerota archaeon]MDG7023457.1 hypothetical protein [Nitrososphaerota archaeon]